MAENKLIDIGSLLGKEEDDAVYKSFRITGADTQTSSTGLVKPRIPRAPGVSMNPPRAKRIEDSSSNFRARSKATEKAKKSEASSETENMITKAISYFFGG